jgi:hypothetical protein
MPTGQELTAINVVPHVICKSPFRVSCQGIFKRNTPTGTYTSGRLHRTFCLGIVEPATDAKAVLSSTMTAAIPQAQIHATEVDFILQALQTDIYC